MRDVGCLCHAVSLLEHLSQILDRLLLVKDHLLKSLDTCVDRIGLRDLRALEILFDAT